MASVHSALARACAYTQQVWVWQFLATPVFFTPSVSDACHVQNKELVSSYKRLSKRIDCRNHAEYVLTSVARSLIFREGKASLELQVKNGCVVEVKKGTGKTCRWHAKIMAATIRGDCSLYTDRILIFLRSNWNSRKCPHVLFFGFRIRLELSLDLSQHPIYTHLAFVSEGWRATCSCWNSLWVCIQS